MGGAEIPSVTMATQQGCGEKMVPYNYGHLNMLCMYMYIRIRFPLLETGAYEERFIRGGAPSICAVEMKRRGSVHVRCSEVTRDI